MEFIKDNALLYLKTYLRQDLLLLQSTTEATFNLLFESPYSTGTVGWGKHSPSTYELCKKLFT